MRFHWRRDEQSPLETLRFTRALFRLASSSFLLGGVIEMHLNHWEEKEPGLIAKIRKELYVDDFISGSTTVCKTRELKEKTTVIFQDARFNLHKWHSNFPELELEQSPQEEGESIYAKQQSHKEHFLVCLDSRGTKNQTHLASETHQRKQR